MRTLSFTGLIVAFWVLFSFSSRANSQIAETELDISSGDESENILSEKEDYVINCYTEVGKRSTAEDYEEEDTDKEYTYHNYHLKFEQEVSDCLSYYVSSFMYNKDYKNSDSLDNVSRIYKTNCSYFPIKLKQKSLKLNFNLKYKEKRYDNTLSGEYDEIRIAPSLTFNKKDFYMINLSVGSGNFDYLETEEKDQFSFFSEIGGKKYFLEKKLILTSSCKIETTEHKKINRDRTKHESMGGFDYMFDLPLIYKLTTRANWGQRDTKEDDERDEDYDYEYWRYHAKTEHKITPKLKIDIKYQHFKKDYISADLDNNGFYVQNGWRYEILDDEKQKFDFELGVEHKDVTYSLKSGNDYHKDTAGLKAAYQRKKNWKTQVALEGNFYDFNDPNNDKKRCYLKLSGEKLFLDGDLASLLDFKYKYTNYNVQDDTYEKAVRVAFKYKF